MHFYHPLHHTQRRSNNALREAQLQHKARRDIRLEVNKRKSMLHHCANTYVEKPLLLCIGQGVMSPRPDPDGVVRDAKIKSLLL